MPIIGITGGIGTGKSLLLKALQKAAPAEAFDADLCVHALLESDPGVRKAIIGAFGGEMINSDGEVDRSGLRDLVFESESARRQLEAILHPRVRAALLTQAASTRAKHRVFYADIPLLYETNAEAECERVVVVACSAGTQRARLRIKRGLAPELIERIIAAQLDLAVKMARADHLVWNDSTPAVVDEQANSLSRWLRQRYG